MTTKGAWILRYQISFMLKNHVLRTNFMVGRFSFLLEQNAGFIPRKLSTVYIQSTGHICPSWKLSRIDELNMDVYVFLNKIVYCLSVAIVVLYWLCPHHFRVQTTRLHEIIVMTWKSYLYTLIAIYKPAKVLHFLAYR